MKDDPIVEEVREAEKAKGEKAKGDKSNFLWKQHSPAMPKLVCQRASFLARC